MRARPGRHNLALRAPHRRAAGGKEIPMGIPVALAAGVAAASITRAVVEVGEKLNTARTCVIEFKNHTGHGLARARAPAPRGA